ncbi:zf-HC2 domain-containing protein [Nocardia alni]|uniref:zf-HC2 domain-containing protein n=1 Tax=Nocardia alni TaxID=2815723 RepID=UPI001C22AB77|nr:zf-HC2 domain-containing protein [Nocardia alni]
MKCETVREALSARLDGEPGPVSAELVDQHLATCPACRDWSVRAERLRRMLIVHTAPPVPDLTAAILDEIRPRHSVSRVALALVAIVQTGLALAQLLGADIGMGHSDIGAFMMGHMSHESAAWNLAVGIGLAWAALHTRAAAAQLPMLSVFVGVLTAASLLDLADGEVTAGRLLSHIPVLVGVGLLYLVYRRDRDDHRPPNRETLTAPGDSAGDRPRSPFARRDAAPDHRRPASRRVA